MQVKGFSLIELMVVIAIIAVLAAVALPAYQTYLRSAKISSAQTILSSYTDRAWQFYETNGEFPTSVAQIGLTVGTSSPLATPTPASASDYLAPYLAEFTLATDTALVGSCPGMVGSGFISNTDSNGAFDLTNSTPYIAMNIYKVDVDGTVVTFCNFDDVTNSGVDTTTSITNCYNMASDSDDYNTAFGVATASCS